MEQELDQWVEQLSQCKQLTEDNVKKLCDKVSSKHNFDQYLLSASLMLRVAIPRHYACRQGRS